MQYRPYFRLSLHHSYYQQTLCPDFSIEPTRHCQRLMQGYRWILKPSLNGLQILIPVDGEQQPFIPFDQSQVLTFLLKLKNPDFMSFTQLASSYQPGRSLYAFSSKDAKSKDNKDSINWALIDTVVQLERRAETTADKDDKEKPLSSAVSALEKRCAAIAELQSIHRTKIFGLVELHPTDLPNQDLKKTINFTATFTAREQVWRYYLVTDNATASSPFSIEDQDGKIHFSNASIKAGDRVVAGIQQQFPDSKPVLLQSDKPIPCRNIGQPKLQLIKQKTAWIPHLPNPPNQHGIQVINMRQDS